MCLCLPNLSYINACGLPLALYIHSFDENCIHQKSALKWGIALDPQNTAEYHRLPFPGGSDAYYINQGVSKNCPARLGLVNSERIVIWLRDPMYQ
jgi:hypothetical protein